MQAYHSHMNIIGIFCTIGVEFTTVQGSRSRQNPAFVQILHVPRLGWHNVHGNPGTMPAGTLHHKHNWLECCTVPIRGMKSCSAVMLKMQVMLGTSFLVRNRSSSFLSTTDLWVQSCPAFQHCCSLTNVACAASYGTVVMEVSAK